MTQDRRRRAPAPYGPGAGAPFPPAGLMFIWGIVPGRTCTTVVERREPVAAIATAVTTAAIAAASATGSASRERRWVGCR